MELRKGQIVISRRGRDVTRLYMVAAVEGDRALLADGARRMLAAPKAKNIRHLNPTASFVPEEAQEDDEKLKAALEAYTNSRSQEQGG